MQNHYSRSTTHTVIGEKYTFQLKGAPRPVTYGENNDDIDSQRGETGPTITALYTEIDRLRAENAALKGPDGELPALPSPSPSPANFATTATPPRRVETDGRDRSTEENASVLHELRSRLNELEGRNEKLASDLRQAQEELAHEKSQRVKQNTEAERMRREGTKQATEVEQITLKQSQQIADLRNELTNLRSEADRMRDLNRGSAALRDANEALLRDIEDAKAQLSREYDKRQEAQDELARLRRDLEATPEVEQTVVVQREGMKARTDLLRRVWENHQTAEGALKQVRILQHTKQYQKAKNSTKDKYGGEFVRSMEGVEESIRRVLGNSTSIIQSYFTPTEKLYCGMSSEWFKSPSGKYRSIEEKVVTTTTTRSSSPTGRTTPAQGLPTSSPSAGFGARTPQGYTPHEYQPPQAATSSSASPLSRVSRGGVSPVVPGSPSGPIRGGLGASVAGSNASPRNLGASASPSASQGVGIVSTIRSRSTSPGIAALGTTTLRKTTPRSPPYAPPGHSSPYGAAGGARTLNTNPYPGTTSPNMKPDR